MGLGIRLVAVLAVGSLLAASAADAQTRGPSSDSARIPGWVFTPSIGMGGAWDDNVLLLHPADRPPPDYASPITPALSLDYTGRRTHLSGGYVGSWVFYRTLEDFNRFDQNLRFSGRHRATSRLTLFAQEQLTTAPSTDTLLLSGVPFHRIGTRTNAATGGVDAVLGPRTSLRGAYTRRSVAFDESHPLGERLPGGHAHDLTLSLARSLSARLTLGGEYTFNRATIGPQRIDEALVEDRFNIQRGSMTAQYRLSPTLAFSGSVGVARLGFGLTHDARTGPTWGVGITRRSRHTVITASYQRSYVPSFGFGGTFQNEEFTSSLLVPFARGRAYVNSSLAWLENDPLAPDTPRLRTVSATNVLGYRTTRWLNVEGYYLRTQQDTRVAGGQLSRNHVGFRLVAARPMKLR